MAPLSSDVVSAQQGLTSTSVALDDLKIQSKQALTSFQQIKLDLESEQLDPTFVIDDLKRRIRVSEAKLAFDGTITEQPSELIASPRPQLLLDIHQTLDF